MPGSNILLAILPLFWPKLPPLGLGCLQSYLAQNGLSSDILDLNNRFYNLADESLKKEWLISCNTALEENIFQRSFSRYPAEFKKLFDYEIIGFSCFKSNFFSTLQAAELVKSRNKSAKIIFGGPEISRQYFKTKGKFSRQIKQLADFLVAGEGELALLDYLSGKSKKISAFRQLKDLKGLDSNCYTGLNLNDYPKKDTIALQFSRGCIRKCNFCSERLLYQGFRCRQPDNLIEEIKYFQARGIKYFIFFDSMLNADLKNLEELCDKIIANFGSINWEAQMAVRKMPERLLKKIKQSGCYNLFVGLESGSDATLKRMNKGFSSKEAEDFFKALKNAGLFFGISLIIGYPGEARKDFQEGLDFVLRNKALIPKIEQINPFTYYDGTSAQASADYKINPESLARMDIFVQQIKSAGFKYTNAFLGNLIEKNGN